MSSSTCQGRRLQVSYTPTTRDKIIHILPEILAENVGRMHIYPEEHMAVVSILDPNLLKNYLKDHQSIELENSASVLLSPAYLLVALPKFIEDDSYSMSRFSDKGSTISGNLPMFEPTPQRAI